jgi:transcriptional regulator with PAS, ATPase and Fis domain
VNNVRSSASLQNDDNIQDTEALEEAETMTLDEVEKEMIKKALEKYRGRRRAAAKELNISERTLYRKIKLYDLE